MIVFNNFYSGWDRALMGKFNGVRLYAPQHLHDPILVAANQRTIQIWNIAVRFSNIHKVYFELNPIVLNLLFKVIINFQNWFLNIEDLKVPLKFVRLNPCEVNKILDNMVH